MFKKNVGDILALLSASSADIAKCAKCDHSNISRMVSGARVPKCGGTGAQRLVDGIFTYADENGKMQLLCDYLKLDRSSTAKNVRRAIMEKLYEGTGESTRTADKKPGETERVFGERLNMLMELTECSNISLGRQLHLDASYISRFRNGLRSPRPNSETLDGICAVLVKRCLAQDKEEKLCEILDVKRAPENDEGWYAEMLGGWLLEREAESDGNLAETFTESIDSFSLSNAFSLPAFEDVTDTVVTEAKDAVYFGREGLQNAVIRFLAAAINAPNSELWLYSDQNTDWLVQDRSFRVKWAALMFECVKRGIRIKIIHNIDRNPAEMLEALNSWLPLYMSGLIESFYCRKQRNSRFSNTFFLCPGLACIDGRNVAGHEDVDGRYRFDTEEAVLASQKAMFDALLEESDPLVRIVPAVMDKSVTAGEEGGSTVLSSTLSLSTLPKETLVSILERSGAPDSMKNMELRLWENKRGEFEKRLKEGFVHECVPLFSQKFADDTKIPIGLPGIEAYYTAKEYKEHLQSIIKMADEHAGYRFFILPEAPFANTHIAIFEKLVAVTRKISPNVTFLLGHPAMCSAFITYADRIKAAYNLDKITAKQRIEAVIEKL